MNGSLKTDGFKTSGLKRVLAGSKKEFSNLKGGLVTILALNEMMSSSSFKSKVCKKDMIMFLAYLFENSEFKKNDTTLDEFRTCVFQILEQMAKNTKLLMVNQKEIMEHLLPVIVKKVESESADVRF